MIKTYEVSCPAYLVYQVQASNKKEAKQEALEEFAGYLRFLSKASEGATVCSSLEDIEVIVNPDYD